MRHRLLLFALLLSGGPPLPGQALRESALQGWNRPGRGDLAAGWRAGGAGRAATIERYAGRRALTLVHDNRSGRHPRSTWDLPLRLDLAPDRGLGLAVHGEGLQRIREATLYLRSNEGWYALPLKGLREGQWVHLVVDKALARVEGRPAGWRHIGGVRLGLWSAGKGRAALRVSRLCRLTAHSSVAVVRWESAAPARAAEGRSSLAYTRTTVQDYAACGIEPRVLSDLDLDGRLLAGLEVVVLPHNPSLPGPAATALANHLAGGGRLVAFYTLPPALHPLTGIRHGAFRKPRRPGEFAQIRRLPGHLPGAPKRVRQRSWNIHSASPIPGRSKVVAWWHDRYGQATGQAAILRSDRCALMTHVLHTPRHTDRRALLLAMTVPFAPGAARLAVAHQRARLGRVGPFEEVASALRRLARHATGNPELAALLTRIRGRLATLETKAARQDPGEALRTMVAIRRELLEAWCRTLRPQAGEHRAFWCHQAFGIEELTWDEAVARLATAGFTRLLPNMLWAGAAYYPSKVVPVARDVHILGDQLAACLAACRRHGVECHLWKVCWNMGTHAPASFRKRMVAAGRVQVDRKGRPNTRWLCPTHPLNRKLEADALIEAAGRYPLDGVHLDYIRYPGMDGCYCDGCHRRFEEETQLDVRRWPEDLAARKDLKREFLAFRRRAITALVAQVHVRLRRLPRRVMLSAAVFSNPPVHRDSVAQDWPLWCRRGYLDFICPMNYTDDDRAFARMVTRQAAWAGRVPCHPGIGLSTFKGDAPLVRLVNQVLLTRQLETGGFTVFNYGEVESDSILPLLGLGLTRKTETTRSHQKR